MSIDTLANPLPPVVTFGDIVQDLDPPKCHELVEYIFSLVDLSFDDVDSKSILLISYIINWRVTVIVDVIIAVAIVVVVDVIVVDAIVVVENMSVIVPRFNKE
jgi:hypothetical protein